MVNRDSSSERAIFLGQRGKFRYLDKMATSSGEELSKTHLPPAQASGIHTLLKAEVQSDLCHILVGSRTGRAKRAQWKGDWQGPSRGNTKGAGRYFQTVSCPTAWHSMSHSWSSEVNTALVLLPQQHHHGPAPAQGASREVCRHCTWQQSEERCGWRGHSLLLHQTSPPAMGTHNKKHLGEGGGACAVPRFDIQALSQPVVSNELFMYCTMRPCLWTPHATETQPNKQGTLEAMTAQPNSLNNRKMTKIVSPLAGCTCYLLPGQKVTFKVICCKCVPDPRGPALWITLSWIWEHPPVPVDDRVKLRFAVLSIRTLLQHEPHKHVWFSWFW